MVRIARHVPFSILGRIEPTATPSDGHGAPNAGLTFSILGRIEPTATFAGRADGHLRRPLSVSSVGSSPLQQPRRPRRSGTPEPFSILGRIEPTATFMAFLLPGRWPSLSVSSVGSSPLQRGRKGRAKARRGDFQYPRSDRAHCNAGLGRAGRRTASLSVSSVGSSPLQPGEEGLDGRGHHVLSVSSVGSSPLQHHPIPSVSIQMGIFQYPRSDRAHCNGPEPELPDGLLPLSVSSVGSSPLQLHAFSVLAATSLAFSILGRIEPTATWMEPVLHPVILVFQYPRSDRAHCNSLYGLPCRKRLSLSVSSVGSSPLQHYLHRSSPHEGTLFQYPRSDRAHCNWGEHLEEAWRFALSVSSVGSSPLQRLQDLGLPRSRGGLSVSSVGSSPLQPRLSVPAGFHPSLFQYPRSDRAHCNFRRPSRSGRTPSTFSILGRIEPTATPPSPFARRRPMVLSVSSVGSSPLQPDRSRSEASRSPALSVSSVGSSPLQPWEAERQSPSDGVFQYPRSDRAHCNEEGCLLLEPVRWAFSILGRIEPTATPEGRGGPNGADPFQYPRSDRAHCNREASPLAVITAQSFQYPRSDRAHCNTKFADPPIPESPPFSILGRIEPTATPEWFCGHRGSKRLSVSSVGSSPLQRLRPSRARQAGGSFSILGRIEPTATWIKHRFPVFPLILSVSSVGSSPLQRPAIPEHRAPLPDFQYPRSDRAHCNRHEWLVYPSPFQLSVSSVGSSPLQLPEGRSRSPRHLSFQYPRSDRAHCNATMSKTISPPYRLSVSSVGSSPLQRWSPGARW